MKASFIVESSVIRGWSMVAEDGRSGRENGRVRLPPDRYRHVVKAVPVARAMSRAIAISRSPDQRGGEKLDARARGHHGLIRRVAGIGKGGIGQREHHAPVTDPMAVRHGRLTVIATAPSGPNCEHFHAEGLRDVSRACWNSTASRAASVASPPRTASVASTPRGCALRATTAHQRPVKTGARFPLNAATPSA